MKRRVWIDTDPAVTAGNGEVDDAFALVQALRSPELDIVGISVVHGNAARDHGLGIAREIVTMAGRGDVPVYAGCAEPGDTADNEATLAIRAALEAGPLAIAALAPLTTVASALARPGAALANVEDIVFVGGRRRGLEFLAVPHQKKPFRDFNFECDVAAAQTLIDLGLPLTLAGWEVASTLWLTPAHLAHLAASRDAAARWLAGSSTGWMRRWTEQLGAPGFTPFDTLAIGWLLQPAFFDVRPIRVAIENDRDPPLMVADPAPDAGSARYLTLRDPEAMRADLLSGLEGVIL